jgi:hypothetical protein
MKPDVYETRGSDGSVFYFEGLREYQQVLAGLEYNSPNVVYKTTMVPYEHMPLPLLPIARPTFPKGRFWCVAGANGYRRYYEKRRQARQELVRRRFRDPTTRYVLFGRNMRKT